MLDEDNWFVRMHPLKSWSHKKCNKEFKQEYKRDGAITSDKNNTKKVGVDKPEEYNFDDIVQQKKQKADGEACRQRGPKIIPDHNISTDNSQITIFWKKRYLWVMLILKHKWHLEHRKCLFENLDGIRNIQNDYFKA